MTIKDMAFTSGLSSETVRAKGKELFPQRFAKGKRTIFTHEEANVLIGDLRKKGFVQPAEPTENLEVRPAQVEDRLSRLESIVEKLAGMFASVLPRLIENRSQAIEAPPLALRAQLRQIVAKAGHTEGNYREVWNRLYLEALYRLNTNLKLCAENRGINTLDYAEQEGYLPELVAIAREIFGAAA